jgi:uncharacterized protein
MIIIDSGFWVAFGNRRDHRHQRALRAAEKWSDDGFVATWPVLTEVVHRLGNRVSTAPATGFIRDVSRGACLIAELPDTALVRIEAPMRRYANLPMDLADASLIILAEEINDGRILSTDARDFEGYRWKSRRPFENPLLTAWSPRFYGRLNLPPTRIDRAG